MESTPTPPASQADDQPDATLMQLRGRAELHLIEHCGLPLHLLPSGELDGGPVRLIAAELRSLAVRRLRLVQRLNTAARNIVSQAVNLVELSTGGKVPARGPDTPMNHADRDAVEQLSAVVLELDEQLRRWVKVLVEAARVEGLTAPDEQFWSDEKSPRPR